MPADPMSLARRAAAEAIARPRGCVVIARFEPQVGAPGLTADGQATVASGYLVSLGIHFHGHDQWGLGWRITRINHVPPIQAPTATR